MRTSRVLPATIFVLLVGAAAGAWVLVRGTPAWVAELANMLARRPPAALADEPEAALKTRDATDARPERRGDIAKTPVRGSPAVSRDGGPGRRLRQVP